MRFKRDTLFVMGAAGLLVVGAACYVTIDLVAAVHHIQSFRDVELVGLRECAELNSQVQENRRTFVYSLTVKDPGLQREYIAKSRAVDASVETVAGQISALRLSPKARQALTTLADLWQRYRTLREETLAGIVAGDPGDLLSLDANRVHPAFDAVNRQLAVLRQAIDVASSSDLGYTMWAIYRACIEIGLLFQLLILVLYFVIKNLERRRTVDALKSLNEELKTAQDLLIVREAESWRLAQVAARTTNAVVITDLEGRIVWINEGFSRLTGYSLEEAAGRKPGSFLQGPETSPEAIRQMHEAIVAGKGFQTEVVNYNKANKPFNVSIDCQPVIEDGEVSGFIAVQTETTERVRLEAGLRDRETRMRLVFDHVLDGIIAVNEKGIIATANPAAERIFGCPSSELVGTSISELMPSPNRELHDLYISNYLWTGVKKVIGLNRQVTGLRKDGTTFPLDLAVSEVQVDGRREFIGVLRDITERKKADEEVHRTRKQLLDLTANLPGAVFQFRKRGSSIGEFLFISEGLEKLCGQKAQEVMENSYRLLASVHPEDARGVKQELRRALRTDTTFGCTYRVRVGEELRWLSAMAVPQRQESGGLVWNGVIMDITRVKEAELKLARNAEELEQAAERAEAAAKAKSEFLATMSHEIRTPMNGVIGMTGLLLETPLSSEQRDWAETIRSSGEALLCVINDVLDFSKIEAGKLDLEVQPFELRALLEEALELVSVMAHRKSLEICAALDDDVPPYVIGDPSRLRQILLNLLSNAIKFTESGEVVLNAERVRQEGETTLVRIAIRDTGIGINDEVKSRLFQSFSQADSSTTRRYGGTGLGLAISKRLVNLMGGDIGVESAPGVGSTFWITMPFSKAEHVPGAASRASLRGKRALIVDDNRTNRSILKKQIGNLEMQVTLAASAAEALALIEDAMKQNAPFDLGVLDLHMPIANGLALTREIRNRFRLASMPLIILTSDRDRHEALAAREMGVRKFLVKPVRQAALFQAVAEVFGETESKGDSLSVAILPKFQGRVLVVEDHPTNQKVIVMRMMRLGCVVDVANDGLEALRLARSTIYDLILMDCQMPVMDGFQATRAIRQNEKGRRVPIIALTANAMEGEKERCLEAGMDDYLAKPVRPEDLAEKLQLWLGTGDIPRPSAIRSEPSSKLRDQLDAFIKEMEEEGMSRDDTDALLSKLLETNVPMMDRLVESIRLKEGQRACFAAHALKGSFGTIGFQELASAARSIEDACNQENWNAAESGLAPLIRVFEEANEVVTNVIHAK